MCTKKFFKVFGLLLVVVLLAAALPTGQAQAATVVTTEADLLTALANPDVTTIELGAHITLTSTVVVNRTVSIDGKNFTIYGPPKGTEPHQGHGLSVYADGVYISNLTITGSGRSNLNFYEATGGVVNNVVLSSAANAGMIVNGSTVTITNVTTSGNAWGGINVDQGVDVTATPLLTVTNVTNHTSPNGTLTPAIWVDKGNEAWVSVPQNSYIKQTVPNTQMLAFFDIDEFTAAFPVHNVTKDTYFTTIQAAIDAASDGDTINVAAGTYVENVDVTKAVTLLGPNAGIPGNGTRVAEAVIQGTAASWVSLYVEPNVPGVTIDGFTFDGVNLTPDGYSVGVAGDSSHLTVQNNIFVNHKDIAIMTSGVYYEGGTWKYDKWLTDVLIKDNLITNTNLSTSSYNFGIYFQSSLGNVTGNVVTNMRNGIQVQPYWNTPGGGVVSGNKFTAYRTGIYFNYTQNETADWEFSGNQIEGIAYPSGVDPDRFNAIRVETFSAGQVEFSHNQVLLGATNAREQYQYYESNVTDGTSIATPNWWGSILGPTALKYSGDAEFDPWCGDAACSFLVSATEPAVSGFYVKDGKLILKGAINVTGGIVINEPLYILLEDGTVIQNSSPCFIVNSSNVHIDTESIGGAKCVPTDGSNGINVAADLVNIIIEGIEFDGTGQTTGSGVAFAGAITDVQVVDNWFHNLGGSGIAFGGAVNNNQGIQGNLFQALGADAIVSPTTAVNAEYNSWDAYGGASLANVDSDPWTHVDLYVQSSGTPWANQVFTGGTITYTVYGNLQNVMGADFTLTYDPALLTLQTATAGAYFTIPALDPELGPSPLDTSVPGVIRFAGFQTTPVTGNNLPIFTATFTAAAPGTAALDLLDAGDAFAMFPGYGPSTNIYPAALLDGTVTVIAAPTLSSTDLAGPYLTDVLQEFHVTLNNPATGGSFSNVLVNFLVTGADPADVNSFEYWEVTTSSWQPMPLTSDGLGNLVGSFGPALGFPIVPGYNATSLFRVNFDTPGTYPVTMTLVDLTTDPDAVLASLAQDAVVYAQPVLSSTDLVGPYLAGIPQEFTLTMTNPAGGGNYTDPVLQFNLPTGAVLEYFDGTTWQTVTSPLDLAALAPDTVTNLLFRATFPAGGSYLVDFTLVETATDPDWTLAALQQGVDVYANYSVTGTVSMQGRTYRGGVLVTLTGPALFAYGPYTATSLDVISSNVSFSNVAESTYTVTVTHARYLDVSSDLMKTKLVNATPTVLTSLELKGGDATDNQVVNLGDASAIGSQYGFSGTTNNGDVNFSGRVDVFDLVLVGGNWNLTAAAAYGGWIP